ncbi:nacrein-like protein [Saccostrea echinata]|uniref:nacrein-like protein n=1 Tax=Saccostrea echinata TaxID=191078 RepID=UPI002A828C8C|nr:nacrein-like protein [Saccostrea echinata]
MCKTSLFYLLYLSTTVTVLQGTSIYSSYMYRNRHTGNCREENCDLAHFSYNRDSCQGPNFWDRVTPCWGNCSSLSQSPININTEETTYSPFRGLKFLDLCERISAKIRNNGHSPHFMADNPTQVKLGNVPYSGNKGYVFQEVHIHLGQREIRGSEHSLNNKFYAMEAHMVFYDDLYESIEEAQTQPGGLAVIAIMVEIEEKSKFTSQNLNFYRNSYFSFGPRFHRYKRRVPWRAASCSDTSVCRTKSAKRLSYLMEKYYTIIRNHKPERNAERIENSYVEVREQISLSDVLPYDWSFYTYHGSLTTPPCYETVQWIVMRCPIKVTRKAFEALGNVSDIHGNRLKTMGIRRPIQRGIIDHPSVEVERNFRCGSLGNRQDLCPINYDAY